MKEFWAWNPPCETHSCAPHNHTLGPFPFFPDWYCCQKLTSLSTRIISEFWLIRSAFNCWNLFFVFDFGGMITWMFEILKKAKSAKIHTYEVSNQAKWYFKLFRVYFEVKLKYYIRFSTMSTYQVDGRLFFSKFQIFQSSTLGAPIVISCSYKKNIFSIYLVLKWLGKRSSHHSNPLFCEKNTIHHHHHHHDIYLRLRSAPIIQKGENQKRPSHLVN